MPTGPKIELPVTLSQTSIPSFTICMYCVEPTSPFVSGGAQLQLTPGNGIPSKFSSVPGIFGAAGLSCTTGSVRFVCRWTIGGFGCAGWFGPGVTGFGVMFPSRGDVSFLTDWATITWPLPLPACC